MHFGHFQIVASFLTHISQGSVGTCARHGGIFKHEFVAYLLNYYLLSLTVKKNLKIGSHLVKLRARV